MTNTPYWNGTEESEALTYFADRWMNSGEEGTVAEAATVIFDRMLTRRTVLDEAVPPPIEVCRRVLADGFSWQDGVDAYSASAIVQVYEALNAENKIRFVNLGLAKMQTVAFRLAAKAA